MVAGGRHGHQQAAKDALVIVRHRAGFSVHQMRSAHDPAAKSCADGLMSQAHAQNRYFPGKVANDIDTDARILRSAWTGRDDDALRLHCFNLVNGNLIVSANVDPRAEFTQILDQVVSKRIVVVENEDHWRFRISAYH